MMGSINRDFVVIMMKTSVAIGSLVDADVGAAESFSGLVEASLAVGNDRRARARLDGRTACARGWA